MVHDLAVTVRAVELLDSLMIAGLAYLFQECMKKDMLFRRYYLWLLSKWIKNWRQKDRWRRKAFLLQPLGLCIFCNSAWMAIVYYLYAFGVNPEILLFIGMTFIWVKVLIKKLG
jgi:hypothetical protein